MIIEKEDIKQHKLVLINQEELEITGIEDVESFNEEEVVLITQKGNLLAIRGEELSIKQLSIESGKVSVEGIIYEIAYSGETGYDSKKRGVFDKLFR
ncbi:sporulation protein YabP [Proteinivorax hydrogeniformans]|uniref:Sporulation protein YabP n=1 Tax=Proteinivorax hydrogeniformans TaxID=1826727 RepID=A0AAU8HTY4_9FIRM